MREDKFFNLLTDVVDVPQSYLTSIVKVRACQLLNFVCGENFSIMKMKHILSYCLFKCGKFQTDHFYIPSIQKEVFTIQLRHLILISYFRAVVLNSNYSDFITHEFFSVPCQSLCDTHKFSLALRGWLCRHICTRSVIFVHPVLHRHEIRNVQFCFLKYASFGSGHDARCCLVVPLCYTDEVLLTAVHQPCSSIWLHITLISLRKLANSQRNINL